ncbi:unnamed protein product [Closterium sp. Naga37s-1]|nr:unnamed protein product [Closterium sp. Naga37s-1]
MDPLSPLSTRIPAAAALPLLRIVFASGESPLLLLPRFHSPSANPRTYSAHPLPPCDIDRLAAPYAQQHALDCAQGSPCSDSASAVPALTAGTALGSTGVVAAASSSTIVLPFASRPAAAAGLIASSASAAATAAVNAANAAFRVSRGFSAHAQPAVAQVRSMESPLMSSGAAFTAVSRDGRARPALAAAPAASASANRGSPAATASAGSSGGAAAEVELYPSPLQRNPAYAHVETFFVEEDQVVSREVITSINNIGTGVFFRKAGPREKIVFHPDEVRAAIVTCGGLCPGINTVIRELVWGLWFQYGVRDILGIDGGYRGIYSRNVVSLNPKVVNDIHKRGGTFLGTSRGGHEVNKIVNALEDRGINQIYVIGGDGTQRGAEKIHEAALLRPSSTPSRHPRLPPPPFPRSPSLPPSLFPLPSPPLLPPPGAFRPQEIAARGLKVTVAGIPKTIDNDLALIDKSFGFDTAVEEAQRAINAAHVEASSVHNGVGLVKLMGRFCGERSNCHACNTCQPRRGLLPHARGAVPPGLQPPLRPINPPLLPHCLCPFSPPHRTSQDCCLIPEVPFHLEGDGGLFEFLKRRLYPPPLPHRLCPNPSFPQPSAPTHRTAASSPSVPAPNILVFFSNNVCFPPFGFVCLVGCMGGWIAPHHMQAHFAKSRIELNLKYIDPTYMIRAVPANASDNIYCTLLAHSAIHGSMAGFTGFTVGPINGRHAYIPIKCVSEKSNTVSLTDRMWARLLSSTSQPTFLRYDDHHLHHQQRLLQAQQEHRQALREREGEEEGRLLGPSRRDQISEMDGGRGMGGGGGWGGR